MFLYSVCAYKNNECNVYLILRKAVYVPAYIMYVHTMMKIIKDNSFLEPNVLSMRLHSNQTC
jgi:hypothetical protein